MLVIGEKINASNRSVAEAIARRDEKYVANLARAKKETLIGGDLESLKKL